MLKRTMLWPLGLAGTAAALAWYCWRRDRCRQVSANIRDFDTPSAGLYNGLASLFLTSSYARLAQQIAALGPFENAVEIGSGPGHTALYLASTVPELNVMGIDISPDMVKIARQRTEAACLSHRLKFQRGDAADLPVADRSVDLVFSTFSFHHWSDPASGLAEMYRVLKPGGQAIIYDLAAWLVKLTHHGSSGLAEMAMCSPFRGGTLETATRWLGLPLIVRLRLRKAA